MYEVFKIVGDINFKVKTMEKLYEIYDYIKIENYDLIDGILVKDHEGKVILSSKKLSNREVFKNNLDLLFGDDINFIKSMLLYFSSNNQIHNSMGYDELKQEIMLDNKPILLNEIDFEKKEFEINISFFRVLKQINHRQFFELGQYKVNMSSNELKMIISFIENYLRG
ncbi:hypothetical protein HP397_03770 [Streptobacillus felis]|uniref:Uncharacterized protein n=1 Tax=Streptobacillus felis TaxID=1384509 RepID=A0A7Z0TC11_9FUSO|nr:hypothetical protein [Streptobacillus felis]NYV27938.1 hypothetical protein [Streptobacillus felis]